jgi:hypothetical protein
LPDGLSGIFLREGLDRANHPEIIAENSPNPQGGCPSKPLRRAKWRELNSARVREDGGFRKRLDPTTVSYNDTITLTSVSDIDTDHP